MSRPASLRTKIAALCFLVSGVATGIYGFYSFRQERAANLEGIDQRLAAAAYAVKLILPPDFHDRIAAGQTIGALEHERHVRRLTDFARQAGVSFVYTVARRDGKFVFTAMSATDEELAKRSWFAFASAYDSPDPSFGETFQQRRRWSGEYTDEYGRFRTVFIPATSPGGEPYMLGADLEIAFVSRRLEKTLAWCAAIGALIFAIVFIASWMVTERISRPLSELAAHTQSLVRSNFDLADAGLRGIEARRGGREILQLTDAFSTMQAELRRYIEELRTTTAAKERFESELQIAHGIQMSFLHKVFPPFPEQPGFDLFATLEPAKEVGGDLYEFSLVGDGRLFLCVGDVSDKGVPAALFMTVTQSLLRYAAQQHGCDPAAILRQVNAQFCERNDSEMFVTVFCAVLDQRTGELRYSNAGHNPPLVVHRDSPPSWLEVPKGIALGVLPEAAFSTRSISLRPGDKIVAYTDGVTEAQDPRGAFYSAERLIRTLAPMGTLAPAELTQALLRSVKEFQAGAPPSDDLTILALEMRGLPGEQAIATHFERGS